jgi:hypothetical protein
MKYCVDTSSLVEAWVRSYPPDVFPSVWEKLGEAMMSGELIATIEVLRELQRKEDELYKWLNKRKKMFVPIDLEIQREVQQVLSTHKTLIDSRRNRSGADPFVIALAKIEGATVVTEETKSNSSARPRIPDVCDAMGLRWLNLLAFIREQKWKFG